MMSHRFSHGRIIIRIVLIAFLWTCLSASSRARLPRTDLPLIVDLGVVWRGEFIEHEIEIPNIGQEPLNVKRFTCRTKGVTTHFDETIIPGQTGIIGLKIDTGTTRGRARFFCNFDSNDPAYSRVQIGVCFETREEILTTVTEISGTPVIDIPEL